MTTEADLQRYLNGLLKAHPDWHERIEALRLMWKLIRETITDCPLPAIGPCDNDTALQMSWTKRNYHISMDIYDKNADGDWFARDREKDVCWSGNLDSVSCLPAELVEHLKTYQQQK
jgi:hypothetical protein